MLDVVDDVGHGAILDRVLAHPLPHRGPDGRVVVGVLLVEATPDVEHAGQRARGLGHDEAGKEVHHDDTAVLGEET